MTAPTIRQLLADVITEAWTSMPEHDERWDWLQQATADALLASPQLAAMFDLAVSGWTLYDAKTRGLYPELEALLADWRASRGDSEREREELASKTDDWRANR